MELLFYLALVVIPPILSACGRGWRGLWFALSVLALLSAWCFSIARFDSLQLSTKREMEMLAMTGMLFRFSISATLGFFLAGIIHRKRESRTAQAS